MQHVMNGAKRLRDETDLESEELIVNKKQKDDENTDSSQEEQECSVALECCRCLYSRTYQP